MLVAEDSETGDIRRFVLIDAVVNLGEIHIGDQTRSFGPEKLLMYINRVENRLFDYVGTYATAFRYIPRRAYEYLKKPPILGDIYRTLSNALDIGWFIDYYLTHPLFNIGTTLLPKSQRQNNINLAYEWAMCPPHSPRFYHVQDMRLDAISKPGWACSCDSRDLENLMDSTMRSYLINHIQSKYPIFVNLESRDDLDILLSWLISVKDGGLPSPELFLSTTDHRSWGNDIVKLVDIPNSRVLTSGSTLSSLSTLINYLKRTQGDEWSTRIVFASGYPNTAMGNSISEVLSYLLSRKLNARPQDIQRILGTNILRRLPIRPNSMHYIENDISVTAEGNLGRCALGDFQRILQVLASQNIKHIVSCDHLIATDDDYIDLNSLIVTLQDNKSKSLISTALYIDRDQTLRLTGWRRTFTDSLISRTSEVMTTLIKAATTTSGHTFDSPSHLSAYTQELLKILQVKEAQDIVSALHFAVVPEEIRRNTLQICPEDLRATGLIEDDLVLAMNPESGQWCAGNINTNSSCIKKSVLVSKKDAHAFDLVDKQVDLVKYDSEVTRLEQSVFSFEQIPLRSGFEIISYLHLHRSEIQEFLQNLYIGRNSAVRPLEHDPEMKCVISSSTPELGLGEVGIITGTIQIRPAQSLRDFNIILCISMGRNLDNTDITIDDFSSLTESLDSISEIVPEISRFIDSLDKTITRRQCAIINVLLILNFVMMNRTEGKLGLVLNGDNLSKFSVQKGNEVQNFIDFDNDISSDEVLTSLVYTLLDTTKGDLEKENESNAYRAIAEYLEDLGAERPTLILLFSDGGIESSEEMEGYLRAIGNHERYALDVFGIGSEFNVDEYKNLHRSIRSRIYSLERYFHFQFLGYLVSAIESLIPTSVEQK